MSLKDIKDKRSAVINTNAKPTEKSIEPQTKENDEMIIPPNGSVRGEDFVLWYNGPETKRKHKRNVDDFPDRLPLEPLREDEKQNSRFNVRPGTLLLEMKEDESRFNERQKKWRENVITNEDLRQEVGKYKKSHNRLRLHRYVFVNNFIYSKNGVFYYGIPLLINVLLLILNMNLFAFVENVIVATVAILPLTAIIATVKSDKNAFVKFMLIDLILLLSLCACYLTAYYNPAFWEKVWLFYALKIFLIYFGFYWFGRYYVIWHIMYVQDLMSDFGNVVKIKCGKPRVGKTSQGIQEAKALALQKWKQLQYDYWLWHSREKEILTRNDKKELLEWYAIKESYEFYTKEPEEDEKPGIPCLWSNIGISDAGGRMAYEITLDHIRGLSRLPVYSVVLFDEIGAVLKNELSLKKGEFYDVSDMFRLGGHFVKWSVIACEQDPKNIYIDCRRVVGANELVKSQQWVCKPVLLCALLKFMKTWIIDGLDKGSKRKPKTAKFMCWFEGFVKSIGFRKQIVTNLGNLETGSEVYVTGEGGERIPLGKSRIRYVASSINDYYDDRAYEELYPSFFSKKIEGKTFKSLKISGFDLEHAKQFVSSTKLLDEKRDALSEKIKEIA